MWPAASWFETLNLRINGLDKHLALMEGQMSYLDPALAPVFDMEELVQTWILPAQQHVLRLATGCDIPGSKNCRDV